VRQLVDENHIFVDTQANGWVKGHAMGTIHDHAEEIAISLGSRIHAMRESRDWTLEMLADRCGLSRAYLSRLEAGSREPSMPALRAIAQAFDVSIAALFEQPDESAASVIIRGGSTTTKTVNGLTYLPLSSSTKPFNLHPIMVIVPANRPGEETYRHVGEEWLYVIAGRLQLSIDGEQFVLEVGDSAHFDSRQPHRLDAIDGKDAQVMLVACPIPLSLNQSPKDVFNEVGKESVVAAGAGLFVG
jgi:transcriptional regulator with XRE-family HTH domain